MFATKLAIFKFSQAKNVTPRIPFLASVLFLCCSNALADIEQGKRIYRENCAPCHGEAGKGDGVGARSLPAHPADHTNAAVMNSRSDAFPRDVIAKGGKAWPYPLSCRHGKESLKIKKLKILLLTSAA